MMMLTSSAVVSKPQQDYTAMRASEGQKRSFSVSGFQRPLTRQSSTDVIRNVGGNFKMGKYPAPTVNKFFTKTEIANNNNRNPKVVSPEYPGKGRTFGQIEPTECTYEEENDGQMLTNFKSSHHPRAGSISDSLVKGRAAIANYSTSTSSHNTYGGNEIHSPTNIYNEEDHKFRTGSAQNTRKKNG